MTIKGGQAKGQRAVDSVGPRKEATQFGEDCGVRLRVWLDAVLTQSFRSAVKSCRRQVGH